MKPPFISSPIRHWIASALLLSAGVFTSHAALIAQWDFSTGTVADLSSNVGGYTLSVNGTGPGYNAGSISLSADTLLSSTGINTTSIPSLATQGATIWVNMRFDTAPGAIGFYFGLMNATSPADWGEMSLVTFANGGGIGQYAHSTTGEYGWANFASPSTGSFFTMALVFRPGFDENGFENSATSQMVTYVNGTAVASGTLPGATLQQSLSFALGKLKASGGVADMTFDQVQVYNTALSASEIAAIPEPSSIGLSLLSGGFLLLLGMRRMKSGARIVT